MIRKANILHFVLLTTSAHLIVWQLWRPILPVGKETKQYLGHSMDSWLNFTELTAKYGYPTEEHTVVTDDGYLLKLFRVRGRNCKERGAPVLFMHGFLQSSACWLVSGPQSALAYQIADQCHDLWLGNSRGTHYSREHVSLNPDADLKYWEFSLDEMARFDTPAMIDYVLTQTGRQKLNYIGYSQGGSIYFAMCSELPHYCDKANILIGLAPAPRTYNVKASGPRIFFAAVAALENVLTSLNIGEILSLGSATQELTSMFCQASSFSWNMCQWLKTKFDSDHTGSIADEVYKTLYGHFPAGTSVKTIVRYYQGFRSEHFQKYDYGSEGNLMHYGSSEPPRYNLSAVTVPTVVLHGAGDELVTPVDVQWMLAQLPNVKEAFRIEDPNWNHLDFPYAQNVKQLVFPKVEEYLSKYP